MTQTPPRRPDRRVALHTLGATALTLATPGWAQGRWPDKPILLLVPFGAGGVADITARAFGEAMGQRLGQPFIIDNRPSAGSIVASQAVATAKPDGNTLLLMSNGHAVSVGLFKKLPYDPLKDFAPISTLGSFDLGVFVAANSPIKSLGALLAQARARPGMNVGTIAIGSTQHLAAKLFEMTTGISVVTVPYKSSPAVLTALRAGEIDVAFEINSPMLSQVQAGVVRVLAVTGDRRNPALPDVPTVAEAGVANYEVASWNALAAPAGTPAAVIEQLNQAVREATQNAAVKDRLTRMGMRLAASTPAEQSRLLASDIRRWGGVIRAAGIQPE